MTNHTSTPDLDGVLKIDDLARLLNMTPQTIRNRMRERTFPIPTLPRIDNRVRWSGPVVRKWLHENGEETGTGKRGRR